MLCEKCGHDIQIGDYPFCKGTPESHMGQTTAYKTDIFPFTLSHVDGKPMTITDIGHLRRVERDYGVAFSAFNKANVRDLDPLKDVPRYRGDDPDGPRRRS